MARPRTNTVATMIRVNGDLKKQAETVCEEMGITLSIACTIFFNAIVKTRSIPFRIQTFDSYGSEKNQDYDTDCLQEN
ncbi:MAG: type II toxin-antitoxin system RelB/DinJ family antitoxin [Synergistaceae bacterium]|nr:type II toxin-antitoxin system RelB/DinJ family antitoxin [Synergistaceae bacterium]